MKNCKKTLKSVLAVILAVLMLMPVMSTVAVAAETQNSVAQEIGIGQFFLDIINALRAFVERIFSFLKNNSDTSGKTEHDYVDGEVIKEPTCEEEGIKTYVCIYCGDVYSVAIPKAPHEYDSGLITTEATCKEEGVKTFSCIYNCGTAYTELIPKIPHTYDNGSITKEPTCKEEGIKTFCCINNCGAAYTEPVEKTGHKYDDGKVASPSTCEKGGIKTYTCVYGCGDTYDEVIYAGHDFSRISTTKETECAKGCGAVLPSFNAIVNDLKDSSTDVKKYTAILEEISHKDKLKVSGSLSSALGDEGNVASTETTYDPLVQNCIITKKNFPTNGAEYVSNLTDSDIKSIKIEKVNKVNYLSPLPDSFTYQNVNYDLAPIKNTAFPEAYKITIVLNEEKVDDITKTVSGTSAFDKIYVTDYRATIETIRTEITSGSDSSIGIVPDRMLDIVADLFGVDSGNVNDYFKTKTAGSIRSNLTVEYYIDAATFAPLGAKYSHRFDFSFRIKLFAKTDILEVTPLIDMTQDMYTTANAYYIFPDNLPAVE